AAAREAMAAATKVVPYLGVVVELAVLDRPNAAVLVRERLVTTLDVDDAEPAGADSRARRDMRATIVRAAMRHRIGPPVEDAVSQDVPWLASDLDHSTNAAHTCFTVVRALSGGDGRRSRVTSGTPDQ